MTRSQIHRYAAIIPLVLSGLALALVVWVVGTGFERDLRDEGLAAHLFQLLIAAELPILALFLATADRSQTRTLFKWLALQMGAIALAFAPVAIFKL